MGRDKAFVEVDGVPMVRRVADALAAAGCSPVLTVGGDAARLAALGLDRVDDRWPGEGPLGGILTALDATRADTVVVATDLPFLDGATIASLVAAAAADPLADAVVATTDRLEPLCALWRARSAQPLRAAFERGERAVHLAAEGLRLVRVRVDAGAVVNVNRPGDLDPA